MRKRHITAPRPVASTDSEHRTDLTITALVEVTSEETRPRQYMGNPKAGVRQSLGTHDPTDVRPARELTYIRLVFEEQELSRTQEFVVRWSPDVTSTLRDIVRQQWNFSPPHTTTEVEECRLDLSRVSVVELTITPDIAGGHARASLSSSFAVYGG